MNDNPFGNFEEVWQAIHRLYLATEQLREGAEQLKDSVRLVIESQLGNVKQLNELTVAMTELTRIQTDHAKRLERLEGEN